MEFYSAVRKNEIMSFAGKWIELEDIMLSDISQVQKDKGFLFSLINIHTKRNMCIYMREREHLYI
jgi:hypothetical protein